MKGFRNHVRSPVNMGAPKAGGLAIRNVNSVPVNQVPVTIDPKRNMESLKKMLNPDNKN